MVGSGFKFRDWFSLARQPQNEPYEPAESETAEGVIRKTAIHEMEIDRKSMASSFPSQRIEALSGNISNRTFLWIRSCRSARLPVFIISYNRGLCLRRAVDSYRRLSRNIKIIIHDNGSTDPGTIAILEELNKEGGIVVRRGAIHTPDELNNVNETIQEYFDDWAEPSRYVVTDCDIDLSIASSDALDVYDEILDRYTGVECVGPMLRIHDIPKSYPLYSRVMNRHVEQFWHREPEWVETPYGAVASIECDIDTTFALHRANEPFRRLKKARRVYHPFEAHHMDWYLTDAYRTSYFETSSAAISHWNNKEPRCDER